MSAATTPGLPNEVKSFRTALEKSIFWSVIGILILFGTAQLAMRFNAPKADNPAGSAPSNTAPKTAPNVPLTSSPRADWSMLTIGPNAESGLIKVPIGMRIDVAGDGIQLVNVLRDGRRCSQDCPSSGDLAGVVVVNKRGTTTDVSYAYRPI